MDLQERVAALEAELREARLERQELKRRNQQIEERLAQVEGQGQRRPPPRFTGSLVLVAVLVLALTGLCTRRAWAAATVPSAMQVTLHLESNQLSAPITLPVVDQPVLVSATTITSGAEGTGFAHLTYHSAIRRFSWSGIDAERATGTTPRAFSIEVSPGASHGMVSVAKDGKAFLATGRAPGQISVFTLETPPLDIRLTLIW